MLNISKTKSKVQHNILTYFMDIITYDIYVIHSVQQDFL